MKTKDELRTFGLVMATVLFLITAVLYWRHKTFWLVFGSISVVFFLSGLFFPLLLRRFEWAWMKLAIFISLMMTRLILVLLFFLVITPVGIAMRIIGKKPLITNFDRKAVTYWEPVEKDLYSRYDKPY